MAWERICSRKIIFNFIEVANGEKIFLLDELRRRIQRCNMTLFVKKCIKFTMWFICLTSRRYFVKWCCFSETAKTFLFCWLSRRANKIYNPENENGFTATIQETTCLESMEKPELELKCMLGMLLDIVSGFFFIIP